MSNWVERYLGIPYANRGRYLSGLDCWGLIMMIYKDNLGIDLPDTQEDYNCRWSWKGKDYFKENYSDKWERVEIPLEYDIVLMQNDKDIANHAGVYVGKNKFIHCIKAGVVIGRITDKIWKNRILGYFRYKR